LLDKGLDVLSKNKNGKNVLHLCAEHGNVDTAKVIIAMLDHKKKEELVNSKTTNASETSSALITVSHTINEKIDQMEVRRV
jgi:ankyrin repeat protein